MVTCIILLDEHFNHTMRGKEYHQGEGLWLPG